jgi:hypothetical protein
MRKCSEDETSKFDPYKKAEIDLDTVDFTGLDEYDPEVTHRGGGYHLNKGSKKREDWESDQRLLDYIGLLAYEYPKKRVAKEMGITFQTLRNWEKESDLIREALTTTRESFCRELEGTLKHRARGYDYEEVKTTVLGDVRKGSKVVENQQTVKIEKTKKHQPGDVASAIFLLTNLEPDKWKNRRNTDTNVTGTVPVVITGGDELED